MYWDLFSVPDSPDEHADCLSLQLLVSKESSMDKKKQLDSGKVRKLLRRFLKGGKRLLQAFTICRCEVSYCGITESAEVHSYEKVCLDGCSKLHETSSIPFFFFFS